MNSHFLLFCRGATPRMSSHSASKSPKPTVLELRNAKGARFPVITAHDAPTARIVMEAGINVILVGDSLGMAVLGYDSTVPVTMDDIVHHTRAARRGAPTAFLIADMPYLSFTRELALSNAARLMKEAGADSVKIEGGAEVADIAAALVKSGVPVVGHIGLTPQTASALGGFKLQGRDEVQAAKILADAHALEKAGCWAIVLELVPSALAKAVTSAITIPTIGIGAGAECDAQVLVFHDVVGLFQAFQPKFVKRYADAWTLIRQAVRQFGDEVRSGTFPTRSHSYEMKEEVARRLALMVS